jgi:hypothetical protein
VIVHGIVHQVWDWLDERRYVLHLFITMEKLDGWRTLHFVGRNRAIPLSDVSALVTAAGFDDIRILAPGETGHYQPAVCFDMQRNVTGRSGHGLIRDKRFRTRLMNAARVTADAFSMP